MSKKFKQRLIMIENRDQYFEALEESVIILEDFFGDKYPELTENKEALVELSMDIINNVLLVGEE